MDLYARDIILPFLPDIAAVEDADRLIQEFGPAAAVEATVRAGRSRDLGNHIHFCRWQQIARLIDLLAVREVVGTVH